MKINQKWYMPKRRCNNKESNRKSLKQWNFGRNMPKMYDIGISVFE